jgi:hypothetical protein
MSFAHLSWRFNPNKEDELQTAAAAILLQRFSSKERSSQICVD